MKSRGLIICVRFVILFLLGSFLLSSCTTTNKHKTVDKVNLKQDKNIKEDSSREKKESVTEVKKDLTLTVIDKTDEYDRETVYEYKTPDIPFVMTDSSTPSNGTSDEYLPILIRKTVKERGKLKETTTTQTNKSDSLHSESYEKASYSKIDLSSIHMVSLHKAKDVERTSYWGWLWSIPIILLLLVIWYYRRRIGGWFTKFKNIKSNYHG